MLMTKAQYAATKNFSKAYLSKKSVAEKIKPAMVLDTTDNKWKIDSEIADKIFADTRDPSRQEQRGKSKKSADEPSEPKAENKDSFEYYKRQREKVKYEQDQMDLLERKGKTLMRDAVEAACANVGQMIREYLQNRNRRIAEKSATMTDAREIKAMLDDDDRVMLQAVSDDLNGKLFKSTAGEQSTSTH